MSINKHRLTKDKKKNLKNPNKRPKLQRKKSKQLYLSLRFRKQKLSKSLQQVNQNLKRIKWPSIKNRKIRKLWPKLPHKGKRKTKLNSQRLKIKSKRRRSRRQNKKKGCKVFNYWQRQLSIMKKQ